MVYPTELNVVPVFSEWLQSYVRLGTASFEDDVLELSTPPSHKARLFKSMKAYGNFFRVSSVEGKFVTADSGVSATCETIQRSGPFDRNTIVGSVTYFGRIVEIIELDYGQLKPIVLLCDWVEPIWRGPTACLRKDKYGFTSLKLRRLMRRSANSFIFPVQASKIFFSTCVDEPEWSMVLYSNPHATRVSDYRDRDLNAVTSQMDAFVSAKDVVEEEDMDVEEQLNSSFFGVESITADELAAINAAAATGTRQFEGESSDNDSLLQFEDDEDEIHE